MTIPELKTIRKVVEFEAFGQTHIAYAPTEVSHDEIERTLKLLTPTVHIIAISTDLIDERTFNEGTIELIINRNKIIDGYGSDISRKKSTPIEDNNKAEAKI